MMNLDKLREYLDSLSETENIPGCDCIVYKGHDIVFRHMAGFSDERKTKPVSAQDRYMLYSSTKLLTCTAALQLIERGCMKLEDEICKYLPEFTTMYVGEKKAQNRITVEHLMTMRAGFDYNVNRPALKALIIQNPMATTAEVIAALAKEPLVFEPGTHFRYSFCHDVLARLIEVVSGMRFGEYMKANIFVPLGMKHSGFSIAEAEGFLTTQYVADPETNERKAIGHTNALVLTPCYECGGAGLVSTVNDYGKFVDAMCNYGMAANGARILSKESIDLMRENRLDPVCQKEFDGIKMYGYGYGLGVRTLIEKENSGATSPIGEFGWDGAAGAYIMIDVENQIGIFYAQQVLGRKVTNIIHTKIRDMVYESLEEQKRD